MVAVILELIEASKQGLSGQLVDRGRVVDQLLDLRLAAEAQPGVLVMVDEMLSSIPGRTVVETTWWLDALDRLAAAVAPEPAV